MPSLDFLVDSINSEGLVIGRNGYVDVPIGTIFTSITKSKIEGDLSALESVDLGEVDQVRLILEEVHWYRKVIDFIPGGHSAGLKLQGSGLVELAEALRNVKEREYVHLVAADGSSVAKISAPNP